MLTTRILIKKVSPVFLLSALIYILCYSQNGFSQEFIKNGNTVTYRGNTFEYAAHPAAETVQMKDAVTNKNMGTITRRDSVLCKMNGNKLYKPDELTTQPQVHSQNGSIEDFLFSNIVSELDKLPDGSYRIDINNIAIDANGRVVYHDGIGLCHTTNDDALKMKTSLDQKIDELLLASSLMPGTVNNKNVAVITDIYFMPYEINVKDHKTTIRKIWK